MKYVSTRDKNVSTSGAQAIAQGISKESGLFVPDKLPKISVERLNTFVSMSYIQRAENILKDFLPEFTADEISESVSVAYGDTFYHADIAPVKKLTDGQYMLELWHGPTCAFKDMALQLLPQLLTRSLKKVARDKEAVILVATSGDTGKAALEGFKDVNGTRMIVFYPAGGVSRIQQLQMVTQEGDNLEVMGVIGNFDDTQTAVKQIFTDKYLTEKLDKADMMFSSANSINWGRLMPQIVYYFSAYCDMVKTGDLRMGESINISVPTGNFGNILAGYYAKEMGLPIAKFICASNENHVLTDFFGTGVYDTNREFKLTNSPSMDILISSNLERLLFAFAGNNDDELKQYMNELKFTGKYKVSNRVKAAMDKEFFGGYLTEKETGEVIVKAFEDNDYLCDTHTAVALGVHDNYKKITGDKTKTVVVSTANPYKFADSILLAIAPNANPKDEFDCLEQLRKITGVEIPKQILELKNKKVRFNTVLEKDNISSAVEKALSIF